MSPFLLLLIFQLFHLSLQYQLFRDLNGRTDQNFQGQVSQWTLSDPSGTPYPISTSTCLGDQFIVKPASVPIGTTLKKTFEDLEDHNFLRFFVKVHYFGEYTSQTVNLKFDQTSFETSKVLPMESSFPIECPLPFASEIEYSGTVSHSASSVTVEFSSNLHGTNVEVGWGLLSFSFITDISTPGESDAIYGFSSFQDEITIEASKCHYRSYFDEDINYCFSCNDPCEECYGPEDKCFTYRPDSPLNALCPTGQTFTSSGCTDCAVEKCPRCDQDVNQCETCLTTCAWCFDFYDPPQCQECTLESNLVLYQGSCIDSCPQGTYQDSDRKCQACQPGCLDCQGPLECIQCDASETTNIGGLCICNEPRVYFQEGSGCTGNCFLGCEQCFNEEECLVCRSGLTRQLDGFCRCDNDGAFYEDDTGLCTGQCFEFCDYCHDGTSCRSCSGNRVPQGDKCICDPLSRVLIGANCECAADMIENPDTLNCDYNDLIDIAYQSTISPLFDAILQVQMNPRRKWTNSPEIAWTADCTFQNLDTKDLFQEYLFTQHIDILLIPTAFLEYKLQCNVQASYFNENLLEISKAIAFQTLYPGQPQVHIHGGPFQMLTHTEMNFILAQAKSSVGKPLSLSDVKTTWTQTGGDILDMTKLLNPSDPFKLTIPKCTLSRGKIYKFKLHVELLVNPGSETSQEVTIGVYAPKVQTQITGLNDNYHLSSESLTLQSLLSLTYDECNQDAWPLSDLIDSSTAMYAWECFYLDLEQFPTTYRLLDESNDITKDPSIIRHPDPLKLFEQSTSSPTLTIPNSYFTGYSGYSGYQFLFYLTVIVQGKDSTVTITKFNVQQPSLYTPKNKTNLHIISSKPFTTVSFTCMSENNCQAFSDDFHTKFVGSNYNSHYSYQWLLNSLDPRSYNTFLTIVHLNYYDDTIVPQILFTISNGQNVASAFFTLPWATPPKIESFEPLKVYPTSGDAYNTKFFLSTYRWADTDLPVSYQFWTSYNYDANYPALNKMLKTFNPYDETILLPAVSDLDYPHCYVGVLVQDNLKATSKSEPTYISLSNEAHSHCEAVNKSSHALNLSKKSDGLLQRFQLIRALLENLDKWESLSSHSPCIKDGSEFKFTAVTEMKEIVLALNSKDELKIAMLNSIVFSSNIDFTTDKNWHLYLNIVDSYYLSRTSILSSEEYRPLFRFLDGLLWKMKTPGTTLKEDPDKIYLYINMFLRSTLSNKILPTDESINFQGAFYTYHTIKTTYCKVLQDQYIWVTYASEGLRANITLRANQSIPQEQCNNEIFMVFMAFRPNTTVFPYTPYTFPQTLLYFDLIDSLTGKSLLDMYTFLLFSQSPFCPEDGQCHPGDGGEGTEIYGIFDLRNQINKIFAKSNIAQIQNIEVLAHFQFWKSVAFWTVLAFSTGFLLSFYWLFVKHPTYCALIAYKSIITERLLKKLNLFFWVIHPLVGIYIYNDPKTTKPVKLAIYYQRLVVVMMFSTIFSTIEKGEGRVFKTYILLFNTLTVTPVNALLSRIFQKFFSMKIPSKIQLFIGIICYLTLLISCFIVMFIIEAQLEENQNKEWALNFLISFFQDLSLSPAISILNKIFFIKLSQSDRFGKTLTNSPKILALLLPETFMSIYKRIFLPTPVTINIENVKETCQSPRFTTMTPLSSNRKLIKFTTLDLLSSRVHTPFELRTRVASENEIGSVDALPMETLISNRFQTLFSEGKIEMIKQGSPTKENFEKFKSIYGRNSSIINPKSSLIRQKTQAKPVTSIEFNPLEPVEVSFGDIWSFEEQLEEINTIDSPVKDQKVSLSGHLSLGESPPVRKDQSIKKEDTDEEAKN